jgi:arginyl-tRNA synthetase
MMQKEREKWRSIIESELNEYSKELDVDLGDLIPTVQNPPKAELGDLAFPLFIYSKPLKNNPNALAQILKERLEAKIDLNGASLMVAGPYLNVKLDLSSLTEELVKVVNAKKEFYGNTTLYSGKNIMVEFSCPNTNKPLHLGHLRNDAIGQSIAAILKANGASVYKVNLINNRGIHICKSMLAYQKYGNGETPESSLTKGDHLVGKYYVKYAQMEKEEPQIAEEAQSLLREWEKGDQEVHSL